MRERALTVVNGLSLVGGVAESASLWANPRFGADAKRTYQYKLDGDTLAVIQIQLACGNGTDPPIGRWSNKKKWIGVYVRTAPRLT